MNLEDVHEIARRCHEGQVDRAGRPYIEHPERVSALVPSNVEKMAALLHDVLEDTDMTAEELLRLCVAPEVVTAVEALTKREGESYEDFVRRAATNPIARAVKLADLADNSDEKRLALLDPEEAAWFRQKYANARRVIISVSNGPAAEQ